MRIDKLAMTSREALQTAMSTAADAQAGAVEPIHLLSALLGAGERNISVIIERIGADPAQLARSTQDAIDHAPKVSGEGQQMGLSNELVRIIEKAEKKAIDFVGLRKRFLTVSSCLMAAIVLCAVVFGVHLDTEFTGGAMITLSYEGSFDQAAVQKTAAAALENTGLTLQTGENVATGDQTLKISMPGTETVTTEQVENLLDSLNENYPDNQFAQLSLSNVSAAMGTKFLQKSLVAVVFALVLILLYIALRFKNIGGLTGGMMAVLALVNDLMVVFGTFVLLRTALDGNFIAAMLTILGYSINDTVVVYDRIRENRALMGKKGSFEELVNQSVNQSARRTLITTITTVMALGVMCVVSKLYGLDSIFTFAFPLMMGMLSGVYTSLCVSTSAWVLWNDRKSKKAETKKA